MTSNVHVELLTPLGMALYFLMWAVVFVPAFSAYARALTFSAKLPSPLGPALGMFVYLVFACLLLCPLVIGLVLKETWRLVINSQPLLAVAYLVLYVLSVLPGALRFRKTHLDSLRALGYFKSR